MGREVRKQVVFDLVTEVAREDMKQLPAGQVGRAEQLTVVPLPARLVLRLLLGELVRSVGEVPAEDDRESP